VICTLFNHGHILTFKHLCLHSITKILRNGPRAHFPFKASVHTGRTRNTAPAAPGRLGNEHHHHDRRAHLDERVRRGYHPRRGGRYDSGEDRSPSPEPPGSQAFSRAIRRAPFPTRFRPRLLSQSTQGRRDRNCGLRTTGWPANWVERTMTTSSSATSPCSSPTPLAPGWSTCLRGRSPTGTTWSKPSGRASPTSNTPSMEPQAHTSCNRRAGCCVRATAPPPAPLPRLLDCGTNATTRGDPAHDPAAPAWHDGQCGQKWASSNGGGRRAGAAVTSSAKLTSYPGAAREPSLTARRRRARVPFLERLAHAQRPPREPHAPSH
jgi:hypothetical protein